jgi:hypothetical protein
MFSFKNIYKAYKDCIKNKRNTLNALNFEANLIENLCNLEQELKSKSYKIGKSICFLAHSPKLREVFTADFKDRVVHHILINKIEPFYEKKFILKILLRREAPNHKVHQPIVGVLCGKVFLKKPKAFLSCILVDLQALML